MSNSMFRQPKEYDLFIGFCPKVDTMQHCYFFALSMSVLFCGPFDLARLLSTEKGKSFFLFLKEKNYRARRKPRL